MNKYDEYIKGLKNYNTDLDYSNMLGRINNRVLSDKRAGRAKAASLLALFLLTLSTGIAVNTFTGTPNNTDLMAFVFENNSSNQTVDDYIFSE